MRVSPFGNRRIVACCQLPDAYRRLLRPSSAITPKTSPMCSLVNYFYTYVHTYVVYLHSYQ